MDKVLIKSKNKKGWFRGLTWNEGKPYGFVICEEGTGDVVPLRDLEFLNVPSIARPVFRSSVDLPRLQDGETLIGSSGQIETGKIPNPYEPFPANVDLVDFAQLEREKEPVPEPPKNYQFQQYTKDKYGKGSELDLKIREWYLKTYEREPLVQGLSFQKKVESLARLCEGSEIKALDMITKAIEYGEGYLRI